MVLEFWFLRGIGYLNLHVQKRVACKGRVVVGLICIDLSFEITGDLTEFDKNFWYQKEKEHIP